MKKTIKKLNKIFMQNDYLNENFTYIIETNNDNVTLLLKNKTNKKRDIRTSKNGIIDISNTKIEIEDENGKTKKIPTPYQKFNMEDMNNIASSLIDIQDVLIKLSK